KYSPSDGGSVTWYEPTPVQTTSNQAEDLIPGKLEVYEGSPAILNWNYNLTAILLSVILQFNDVSIVAISSDGKVGPVNHNFRERFSVNISTPQNISLSISKVTTADDESNGEFTCELNDLNAAKWRRAIQVQVVVPLSITGIGGKPTVLEGNNLQLICKVSSRLEANVSWTKEKAGNQGNTRVVQEGKVLNVPNINRTAAGTFTCRAYNGFGKPENQTVYVDVVYPAKIVKFQPKYIGAVQQSVTLNCEAEGNPPPTYTWTPCNDIQQVCDKNTLHISQVFDDANYTCRVANVHGLDSKTANVYIGGNVINITIFITSEICIGEKYQQSFLLEKFKELLEEAFADKLGYEGVQLIGVRCGSIDLALKFNSTTKERDVIITLNDNVKDGKLGEFSVHLLKGKRPDVEQTSGGTTTPTDASSGGIAWWIILIIVFVVVILLVFLVMLYKWNRKHLKVLPNGRQHSEMEAGSDQNDNQKAGSEANHPASNHLSSSMVVVDETNEKVRKRKSGELRCAGPDELTGREQCHVSVVWSKS
ncbi:unnamed protein product, partial [Pocillopora meandrina]